MATALDVITQALIKMKVYAAGETISDADAEQCLTRLNDMLDSWSNESLTCYAILEQSCPLVAGQTQYTIGPGGQVNAVRPLKLIEGPNKAYSVDSVGNRYFMDIVPRDQWNLLFNVSGLINADFPEILFYDPQYPLGILNFWPQPNTAGYTAYFDSYLQLTEFSSLTATINLPLGYKKAMQDNLVIEAWDDFKPEGSMPTAKMANDADVAKAAIKRTNIRPMEAGFDFGSGGTPFTLQDFYSGR